MFITAMAFVLLFSIMTFVYSLSSLHINLLRFFHSLKLQSKVLMKKMAEVKDMCSTPPVRAPKSQLTGEQPLTEDT